MCTYNGSRFLPEQLNSIASQNRLPEELVICDDRSIDDTVALVEQLTIDYLTNFLEKAKKLTSNNKPRVDEMLFVLRNDDKKLSRVEELLYMNEELKKARKAFDVDETET